MVKWEYLVTYIQWNKSKETYYLKVVGNDRSYPVQQALDALGSEGWELVTSSGIYAWHGGQYVHIRDQDFMAIFKRPASN